MSNLKPYANNNPPSSRWNTRLLPNGVPALAGVILGVVLAFLITQEMWVVALALAAAVPAVALLMRRPLTAILLWVVLMPFLPAGVVHPAVLWLVHRALIPLALGITILSRLFKLKEHPTMHWGRAEWSMVAYLAFGAVLILLTLESPLLFLYSLYDRMFVPLAAYWLIRLLQPDEGDTKRLFGCLLFVSVAEIVVGFWAQYAPQSLPAIWSFPRMGDRMSGTFSNPTPYAYTLMLGLLLMFYLAMKSDSRPAKALTFLALGLGTLSIFLTFTRGCWLAAIIALLGLLALYPKAMLRFVMVALPVLVILAGSVFASEMAYARERLITEQTIDSRLVLNHAGKKMFYARPLFGWGFGTYDRYDWQFMEPVGGAAPTSWDIQKGTSHNSYLTILAEMGIVGFLLQFFPALWLLWMSVRVYPRLPRQGFGGRRLLAVLWLSIIFYLIASQVVDMRFFWYQIGTWWLTLGLIANLIQPYVKSKDSRPQQKIGPS